MRKVGFYRDRIERIEATVEYKIEVAALRAVDEVVRCMREQGVNQAELARTLGTSEAYVSKMLRGDTNFTLATMVKIANALGTDLHLHLAAPGSTVRWIDVIQGAALEPHWPTRKPRSTYGATPGGRWHDVSTPFAA